MKTLEFLKIKPGEVIKVRLIGKKWKPEQSFEGFDKRQAEARKHQKENAWLFPFGGHK